MWTEVIVFFIFLGIQNHNCRHWNEWYLCKKKLGRTWTNFSQMEEKKNLATRKQKGKAKQGSGTEVWEGVFLFLPKSMSDKLLTRSQQVAVNIVEKQQKKLRQQQEKPPQKQSSPIQVKMGTFRKNGGMRTKIGIKNRSAVAAVGRWRDSCGWQMADGGLRNN